ncbi:glycosyltransferase family 9 protein [Aeromonas dhakensis]|uniref:glycosyltransferase family 9 protein n=1 Tax=Aeromonas dhakensis TaxID=196024 RepID=UPI0036F23A96
MTQKINRICILRLSAIGDTCNAVVTVQALQKHFPDASITWVIGLTEHQLLDGLEGVEFVKFNKKLGLKAFRNLVKDLKGQEFDVLLHMQLSFRANMVSFFINAKRKIGFNWYNSKEFHSLFVNEQIEKQDKLHVLAAFAGFARHLGVPFLIDPSERPVWKIPLTKEHKLWAQKMLIPNMRGHFVISPCASHSERNWSAERYAAIADYVANLGFAVYLCGGATIRESQLAEQINTMAKIDLVNLVGRTDLKQMLALLELSSFILGPDTGTVHLAVAVSTPVIGLYGHSNPERTGPYTYRKDYIVEVYNDELKCQTGKKTSDVPWGTRVKGFDIMDKISVDSVIDKINHLITTEGL